ncbi:MAG: cyclic nucleotide-binding domain-containing protein [Pseudobdellovibrionaceae bacterium]|nr:cyclic nucleotide-binding domain-containing protein [Bdellovibrionales bacterium]USN48464.1 MAG: cyclic nucleotide-binding domain-containing protein [Pseudobdellovibrionaceae bacterium]
MSDGSAAKKINSGYGSISIEDLGSFDEFPEDVLLHLKRVAKVVRVPEGTEVLHQGEKNDTLYFLVSGNLEVFVDGGRVANLSRLGDLIGEMSVITDQPVAATIIAKTPVEMITIDSKEFLNTTPDKAEKVQYILYRVFATILIDKLRITNQKAKALEETMAELNVTKDQLEQANELLEKKVEKRTKDLQKKTEALLASYQKLEQQNAALTASHNKIEELYSTRKSTFKKLEELLEDHLRPLKVALNGMMGTADTHALPGFQKILKEVDEVTRLLEPITDLYNSEMAMEHTRVLLAEPSRKDQVVAKLALGGTGAELDIVSTLKEGQAKLAENSYNIVFVDRTMLSLVDAALASNPSTKCVFMTSEEIPNYLPDLKRQKTLPNLVSRDANDRRFTVKNIVTTVSKLMSRDIFGLEKYLSWGVEVHEHPVVSSESRRNLITAADDYFTSLGLRSSLRDKCRTVLEELLMNAIYDAPVDANGKAKYNHLSRQEEIHLPKEEQGLLRYACDGNLMAVSVSDPFGALTGQTILNYLDSCYGGRAGALNVEKGGAGRGLHQIVENSNLVVFNVATGQRTEVIALFNLEKPKDIIAYPSFHFFSY